MVLILGFQELFVKCSCLQWGLSLVLLTSYLFFTSPPGATHLSVHTHGLHSQACGSCDACAALKMNTRAGAQNLNEMRQ